MSSKPLISSGKGLNMANTLQAIGASTFIVSESDKARLIRLAPLFNTDIQPLPNKKLRITTGFHQNQTAYVELPENLGFYRLILELSSKMSRWVYFHQGEHCSKTLLGQTDEKIKRVSELYKQWVLQGCPP